jgi:hypothetical protein
MAAVKAVFEGSFPRPGVLICAIEMRDTIPKLWSFVKNHLASFLVWSDQYAQTIALFEVIKGFA